MVGGTVEDGLDLVPLGVGKAKRAVERLVG